MLDWHVGYGIYSDKYFKGGLYVNAGAGLLFPGKKMQPFVLFKYELRQFNTKPESLISHGTYNNNYFNASIGISL
jgi:hypothetical protein